jgi:hypothetical protein
MFVFIWIFSGKAWYVDRRIGQVFRCTMAHRWSESRLHEIEMNCICPSVASACVPLTFSSNRNRLYCVALMNSVFPPVTPKRRPRHIHFAALRGWWYVFVHI